MKPTTLHTLLADRAAKRPVVLATPTDGPGEQRLVYPGTDDPLAPAAATALRLDQARDVEIDATTWFLRPYNPPLRMMLIGAVHIAQPLSAMATQAGYAVTVIDPRAAFAAPARFPGVDLVPEWPDEALEALSVDTRTHPQRRRLTAARGPPKTGHLPRAHLKRDIRHHIAPAKPTPVPSTI